ncbi:hypothetical protein KKJ14_20450, partial [Xenorhabdus bovienii]
AIKQGTRAASLETQPYQHLIVNTVQMSRLRMGYVNGDRYDTDQSGVDESVSLTLAVKRLCFSS